MGYHRIPRPWPSLTELVFDRSWSQVRCRSSGDRAANARGAPAWREAIFMVLGVNDDFGTGSLEGEPTGGRGGRAAPGQTGRGARAALPFEGLQHGGEGSEMADTRPRVGAGAVIAGYDLEAEVGAGAAGVVYRARHCERGGRVALKVLHAVFDAGGAVARRFEREAQLAATLKHAAIVELIEAGYDEASGRAFIAFEYLSGGSLEHALHDGPLELRRALAIAERLAEALMACERAGLVHRDLKPANVLFDERGCAKLADFGLVKKPGAPWTILTKPGELLGTPHYMSPEQLASSADVDARTDLYSLGATLFHMLTGRPPFAGGGLLEIAERISKAPAPDPGALRPGLTPSLRALCMALMAKKRSARPRGAEEVMRALRAEIAELEGRGRAIGVTRRDREARGARCEGLGHAAASGSLVTQDSSSAAASDLELEPVARSSGISGASDRLVAVSAGSLVLGLGALYHGIPAFVLLGLPLFLVSGLVSLYALARGQRDALAVFGLLLLLPLAVISSWGGPVWVKVLVTYIASGDELDFSSSALDPPIVELAQEHLAFLGWQPELGLTNAGLRHVGSCSGLEGLELGSCRGVTSRGFLEIGRLTELRRLDLFSTRFADRDMVIFRRLTRLSSLDLSYTQISNQGLAELSGLRDLEELDLEGVGFSDDGVAALLALRSLKTLRVRGTKLSDVGLRRLSGLRALELLDLRDTAVSGRGLEALRAARPGLEVLHEGAPR